MLLRIVRGGDGGPPRPGSTPPLPEYVIASATAPLKPGEGVLHLSDVEVKVDPVAEWKQMYHDAWRIEKSYFYDPNLHGVNAADGEKEFQKYLDGSPRDRISTTSSTRCWARLLPATCAEAVAIFQKR